MALVVSIQADDFGELERRALSAAPSADLVELRLDRLAEVSSAELAGLFSKLARPAIVAVNGPEAYGTFRGNPAERRAILLRAAQAGAAFVDIDWRGAREWSDLPAPTRRIVSRHERALVGSAADAERELRAQSRPGDWLKLVVEAKNATEGLGVLSLLDSADGDLIAFASGSAGSFTRILAPILGSPLTYAAADSESTTAPGQLSAAALRDAWPAAGPSPNTKIFAVLGARVAHSISPRVHTRALREAGVDGVFVALATDELAKTLAACASRNWRGFAVTAPHKQAAFALATELDAASRRARASNTLVRTRNGWSASNTDVAGVRGALDSLAKGASLAGRPALVLGAGGAARAAVVALEDLGVKCTIASRSLPRARDLAAEFGATAIAWEARSASAGFEVIVQCTSASEADAEALLPDAMFSRDALVLDAVYRPLRTPLIRAAERCGARTATGAEWFMHQAERQFELLTGQRAPQGVIRAEVLHALA